MTSQGKIPLRYMVAPSLKTKKAYGLVDKKKRVFKSTFDKDGKKGRVVRPVGIQRAKDYIYKVYGEDSVSEIEGYDMSPTENDDTDYYQDTKYSIVPPIKVIADDEFPFKVTEG